MKKKLLVFITAICMVFAYAVPTFAEDGQKTYPNLMVSVYADNIDCIHASDAEVSLKISKEGMDDILVPVTYDEDMGSYYIEDTIAGIDDIITDVKDEYDQLLDSMSNEVIFAGADEDVDILKKMGYTVEVIVKDTGDGHTFTVSEVSSSVLTYKAVTMVTDWIANLIIGMMVEEFTDEGDTEALEELDKLLGGHVTVDNDGNAFVGDEPVTFDDLLKAIENNEEAKAEMDEEDLAAINDYKNMIAALENGSYKGELMIDVGLDCKCKEYYLYHEYYDADGKYIAQLSDPQIATAGSVVKVEDIKLIEKYDGVNYKFDGVYLIDEKTGEADFSKPVEEYTVPDVDGNLEVIVKYISNESTAQQTSGAEDKVDGNGKSPDTGDDMNVLPFAVIMVLAAAGAAAAVRRRA